MKKQLFLAGLLAVLFSVTSFAQTQIVSGRTNEVFLKTNLSNSGLTTPWEITYGPDGSLWVTDAKAYKVFRIDLTTKAKTPILDLSDVGSFPTIRRAFTGSQNPWPQGGLAGMAIHPDFNNPTTPKPYVYISYVRKFDSASVTTNGGYFFKNSIVRFTYSGGVLGSPVVVCDTLPGSSDHNSQRLIIVPVNGVSYLMYGSGDMGAGQLSSAKRVNRAQDTLSYQGKILRFNLEPDADADPYDQWIPNDNPYNHAAQSAVWATGVRNNQGFAYDSVKNILYGSTHGPYSDDEINIIDSLKNYGHPIVIGYAADGNYNGSSAGAYPASSSSLPAIVSEAANAAAIGARYRDPIYTTYPSSQSVINNVWTTQPSYLTWPGEAWSGMDLYNYSAIPGWRNSLLVSCLKWGRMIRLKLNAAGTATYPAANTSDTVITFDGTPRYRDIAISPDGKDIYIAYDNSTSAAAPSGANDPLLPACNSCIDKFTFLGYNTVGGTSSIPTSNTVASGKPNMCENANYIVINANNKNLWVPITDTLGNIVAEINANGNLLDTVRTTIYTNSGTIRETHANHTLYADRNLTITPKVQPSTAVSVRLYLTAAEFNTLKTSQNSLSQPSNVNAITDISIFKNSDVCGSSMGLVPTAIGTTHQSAFGAGYVVQVSITSFSSFFFMNTSSTLSLNLISFTGAVNNDIAKLKWLTDNEKSTKSFTVERSTNNRDFYAIGTVPAINAAGQQQYGFADSSVSKLGTAIVYYRLKMTDIDGRNTSSPVVTLYTGFGKGVISIHPNPVVNNVTVDINAIVSEQANWEVTDISGKTVMQNAIILTKGRNSINLNLGKLPAGSYYLKVAGNNINQAIKLQKQ